MAGKTRKPHKEGCMCADCKAKRAKAVGVVAPVSVPTPAVAPPPVLPSVVLAGSLKPREKFEFNGRIYMAGVRETDFIMATDIGQPGAVVATLGLNTKVKLIK